MEEEEEATDDGAAVERDEREQDTHSTVVRISTEDMALWIGYSIPKHVEEHSDLIFANVRT